MIFFKFSSSVIKITETILNIKITARGIIISGFKLYYRTTTVNTA